MADNKRIEELEAELAALKAETAKDNVVEFPKVEAPAEVEAEFEEVAEAPAPEGPKVQTMLHVGYFDSGDPIFSVEGDANLLVIEGLLNFAKRELDKVWAIRDQNIAQARAEAAAAAAQEETTNE